MTYPPQPPAQPTPAPHSQPKKRPSTGAIVALVAVSLAVLCCGGVGIATAFSDSGKKGFDAGWTATSTAATSSTPTASKPPATPTSKAHAKLNQPVRDGKFEFTVTAVKYGVASVGGAYLNKKAQGQFVLITMTVKNVGDKPQRFSGGNQKARSAAGAEFSNDTAAELYANDDAKTFLNEINPGNQVTGATVELHDSAFSGGVVVDLV